MATNKCVVCSDTVRRNQHALSCDRCDRWTHRTCYTSISKSVYLNAVRSQTDLAFTCMQCQDDEARALEMPDVVYPTQQIESTHLEKDAELFQGLGLQTAYKQQKAVYQFCRKLLALSFLPASTIVMVFEQMEAKATTPLLQSLMGYIRSTWIDSTLWPPMAWSVYIQPIRTNRMLKVGTIGLTGMLSGPASTFTS